jgi:hypothetical protein
VVNNSRYTTQLQAGLGLISETKTLLELWAPAMTVNKLYQLSLDSGRFPNVTARRIRNIVVECFAPRYLVVENGVVPAQCLKKLMAKITSAELIQLMFLFTCRANLILGDFVRDVYWARYVGGYSQITNDDARIFVERGIDDGKTIKRWSETTVKRVSAYLTGCCGDYGLLERGQRSVRPITPFRITSTAVAYIAYELHFSGISDNAILLHEDWQLFGLAREDVLDELKRLSLKGLLIIQAAGDVIRISWTQPNMETLCDVLS